MRHMSQMSMWNQVYHTQMSQMRNAICRTRMSHVPHSNESRLNLMRHMSQMSMWNQVYHTRMGKMRNEICRTEMSNVSHSDESCLKLTRHMSHVRELCLTRKWAKWGMKFVAHKWTTYRMLQPIAFGVSFNLNLQSQSPWSLFNGPWQKRPRELDHRLRFEIDEMTLQMQ